MKINRIEKQNFKKSIRITNANRHTACKSLLVNKCKYFENPQNLRIKSCINKLRNCLDYFSSLFNRKEVL